MLEEARRLYDLGWAIHWIRPHSKAPVKAGWTSPKRDDWETVRSEYKEGYGLGVRMGEASRVEGGYLANIDVDLKSGEKKHHEEAVKLFDSLFPGIRKTAPYVQTGYGFRFFVKTKTPVVSGKLGSSHDLVKVLMPTAPINRQQSRAVDDGLLTSEELAGGYRVRGAWEIELMSIGKQVVLPPTTHPDTGKKYVWGRGFREGKELSEISISDLPLKRGPGRPHGSPVISNFTPVSVDLVGSRLSDEMVDQIVSGKGVVDRSATCFTVCMVMVKQGFSDDEILSVLTDPENFLGQTGYDHRQTSAREGAAAWVEQYCLRKAKYEVSASRAFEEEVEVLEPLSEGEAQAQARELVPALKDWRLRLKRSGKNGDGPPKAALENVVLIFENAVGFDVFKRDVFAYRDFYGMDTPWGGKAGKALTDDDGVMAKLWIAEKFGFSPNVGLIFEAMTVISVRNAFHPVRDQLENLAAWDLEPRLDTWLKGNFEAEGCDEYIAQVFRKWLVAMIGRIYHPGLKFDWMPIFEGPQGVGKSSFGRLLVGDQWFLDWLPNLADKDSALGLQGCWGVEMGELASMGRNEMESVKAFITRQVDKVRPPFGKKWLEVPRQCVFFGTTNQENYLRDKTGNRRFKPMKVGQLDFKALKRDRDQLLAEALFIWKNDLEPILELEGEAKIFEKEIHAEKIIEDESDLMKDAVLEFIETQKLLPKEERFDFFKFKLSQLMGIGQPLNQWFFNPRTTQFLARGIKMLGGSKRKIQGVYWWKLPLGELAHPLQIQTLDEKP